ncbi:TIGR04222 domain-containing membrane protein [Streptomyces bungoensis]|uniref:TIGR04222 domain-containing membrane protein n=1 Tax=Streptomyces bungoensis TaxID=285568 RepID=UPI00341E0B9A
MERTPSVPPDPCAVALLRGGARAAVTVAVVGLHLRGVVLAGRPGTLRRIGTPDALSLRHPLEKAVRTGLYRPAGLRELAERAVVRRALARTRAELAAEGLLRPLPPGRTRAARRLLASLRARRPLPGSRDGLADEEVLLAVALYGERALTALLPGFTRDAGLTGRGSLADEGLFPWGRGSGSRFLSDHASRGDGYGSAGHGGSYGDPGGHHGSYGGHDHGGGWSDHGGGWSGCGGGGYS